MNERGLVEVPENAVRDEPIAFGLTPVQLGICALAVAVAALLNLLPVWEPVRVVFVLVGAGPVALAAALPVRGEPAYRWLLRAVRHRRGRRVWHATLVSVEDATAPIPVVEGTSEAGTLQAGDNDDASSQSAEGPGTDVPPAAGSHPNVVERAPMEQEVPRLRVLGRDETGSDHDPAASREELERPPAIPHVLAGLRVVGILSFAGGVGKTTLAVEVATYVAARARYRTLDGDEEALRVLLLDASRTSPAAGLRLGLDADAVSRAMERRAWTEPGACDAAITPTRWRVDVVTVPPSRFLEREGAAFGAVDAQALLDGATEAGYQLLVVDLGSVHEPGHRHLIDQASVLLGIVRPTIESLPDVPRLADYVRALGMGRKLALVGAMTDDDGPVRAVLGEDRLPIAGVVPRSEAVALAGERGEPAWRLDPAFARALSPVAAAAWPLVGAGAPRAARVGLVGAVRRALHVGGAVR
ncbi:MAG: hypothetical protein M0Z49_00300 [Chloroflexi bacterium]|nr:hypothetical protein [Chloroflexota bacterium]